MILRDLDKRFSEDEKPQDMMEYYDNEVKEELTEFIKDFIDWEYKIIDDVSNRYGDYYWDEKKHYPKERDRFYAYTDAIEDFYKKLKEIEKESEEPNFYVYDLVMFRNKETTSVNLETINTISSYNTERFGKFHINRTNTFNFTDKLEVLIETSNIIPHTIVNDNIEIVGIWRFNKQNKNYEVIYYEDDK